MLIAPSLLAADFANLEKEVRRVDNADFLHIDVMDGAFVPNLSLGPGLVAALREKTRLVFDVHLMLMHPLQFIKAFADAGADLITFHPESGDDPAQVIAKIKACGKQAGLAIKPATAPEEIFPYLEGLYMVTIMSVEPGFGGQKMMPETLKKAKVLKARCPGLLIEVDGGVDRQTISLCEAAGIDIAVAGTAVFGAPDPEAAVAHFASYGPGHEALRSRMKASFFADGA